MDISLPDYELQVAIVNLFANTPELAGIPVSEFVGIPTDNYPIATIQSITSSTGNGGKACTIFDVTLNMQFTDRGDNTVSTKKINEAAQAFVKAFSPSSKGPYPAMNGFEIGVVVLQNSGTRESYFRPYRFVDKTITLSLKITQNE